MRRPVVFSKCGRARSLRTCIQWTQSDSRSLASASGVPSLSACRSRRKATSHLWSNRVRFACHQCSSLLARTKPQRHERRDLRLLLRELGLLTAQYLCAAEASLISVYSDISRAKWLLMSYSPIAPAMLLIPWRRRNAT